jgi:hypothetical protein
MGRSRRLLFATACVEAVAVASVFAYGYLSLVAVAILYWIDLLFLVFRMAIQRLMARKTTSKAVPLGLLPFRFLKHKRGSVSVTDRLPQVYPRNVPDTVGVVFFVVVSAPTTAYVAKTQVPAEFWEHTFTPFFIVASFVAAAMKSWLILKEHTAQGVHEDRPADSIVPAKRPVLFMFYAGLLYLASEVTVGVAAENGIETARNGLVFWSLTLSVLRSGYGFRASRKRFSGDREDTEQDGFLSRFRSRLSGGDEAVALSPPSVPEGRPKKTAEPRRVSLLTAGIVNAVTTGGVIDKDFSTRGLDLRVGFLLIVGLSGLGLFNGAVGFFLAVVGGLLVLGAVSSAVSAGHMLLAFGAVEYRFYDSEVVAYDRRLGVPQWSVPYDSMEDVSVERGLFGSPLWLDAGTVFFERTDSPKEDELEHHEPRSSIPFVPDPDRVGRILRQGGP